VKLTHLGKNGEARMVDVAGKPVTARDAVACGFIRMSDETLHALRSQKLSKGDALAVARVAGIQAAKRTDELIPLCHSLPLSSVEVSFQFQKTGVEVRARARCEGKTGVEMEALTAASVALLTLYDMTKAVDKNMVIGPIYLAEKSGGRSGHYRRETPVSWR
jgi:cyclic pyranopterin monophosphate synthase